MTLYSGLPAPSRAAAIAMALAAPTKPRPCTQTILRPCPLLGKLLKIAAGPSKIALQFYDLPSSDTLTGGASTVTPSLIFSSWRSARGRIEKNRRTTRIMGRS